MKYYSNLKKILVVALISLAVFTLSHMLMALVNLGTLDVVGLRVWLCLAILYGVFNVVANLAVCAFVACTILWITIFAYTLYEHKKCH